MAKTYNGTAVPRHFVFVTALGTVIAQLSGTRGQDLYTGQIVDIDSRTQSSPATDAELDRLKVAGRVDHYNPTYVWISGLPEPHIYDAHAGVSGASRVRSYYINTLLAVSDLENVRALLDRTQLNHLCTVEIRSNFVAILGADGAYWGDINNAENVLAQLQSVAPKVFNRAVLAFTNVEVRDSQLVHELHLKDLTSELDAIIAAQSDTHITEGKSLLLLVNSLEERRLIYNLCMEMKISVQIAASAADAMTRLEDEHIDLLIMDLQLSDMHGWEILSKIREVENLKQLRVIMIADHAFSEEASLSIAVANVDVYLERPLSKARLRQNIWVALNDQK